MKNIITISREYCSGGHTIGQLLAKELNIPFYDKEIIDMTAQQSGLSADYIKNNEQNLSSGWLYTLLLGASYASPGSSSFNPNNHLQNTPLADQVFNAQRKVIVDLAKKGPCVIVGRCSDYILKHSDEIDKKDLLNVFIYAPIEDKVKRGIEEKRLDPSKAEKEIKLVDKRRANHYNTFTERTWGNRSHYDLLLNSSLLGLKGSAKLIAEIAKKL